jgi:diadenylate cyclase
VQGFEHFRLLSPTWRDFLEVALVAFVLYRALLLFQRTRAVRILLGLVVLVAAYLIGTLLKLGMITYLLGLVFQYGAIALLIVFHPELRAALAHLGRSRRFFPQLGTDAVADEIALTIDRLSVRRVGAIIAIERTVRLDNYVHTGSEMRARVSADLLITIFTPHAPLHDGAVIVQGDTIIGAGCILPLSHDADIDRSLGTRHRAALGLVAETDALVIVVSEETGVISFAEQGRLWSGVSPAHVKARMVSPLTPIEEVMPARAGAA